MSEGQGFDLRWDVKIPMRDGVQLNGTLYMPREAREPLPCVLTMTPYIAAAHHEPASYFATHGFPFLVVDVRGRGNSAGRFNPLMQEARDGHDVVEWLAQQSYCNGKVAMWGGSYLGHCQWAAASTRPPHLSTIVPTAAPFAGIDFPMRNNIFFPFALQWLVATHGRASQGAVFMDSAFWSGLLRRWHESGRPLRELDAQLGIDMSTFHEWLDHPQPDGYWDACNPAAEDYARLELPILTITGSYDDDQPGALEHYRNHIRRASPAAQARHYLIIGPWDHSGAITPAASFGGLSCGSASLLDLRKLHVEWYAWTLQNGPRPEFLRKRVAYYVMGSERWRYAETLDSITARHEPFFLDSNGHADDVYCSGTLKSAPGSGPPDTYRYDPRDTSGPEVAAQAEVPVNSIVDQRLTSALQGKCVVYHSAPFERDTEVSGFFRLSVWLAIDCPDTDFYLSIYDVAQDGSCIRLSTDALRARYREGLRTPKLIDTSKPLRYDCERFTFVSREIRRGHRLRLVIAPLGRLMETTFSQKNYQAGGVVANESAEDGRPVSVSVHHDEAHPSVLYVPFGRTDD